MKWWSHQKSLSKPPFRVIKRDEFVKWERRRQWWQVFGGYAVVFLLGVAVAAAAWKLTGLIAN